MERILNTVLIICLVLFLYPASVFAADKTYYLDEIGMSISIPDGHTVLTRGMEGDDNDGLIEFMIEQNAYLNAWDHDLTYEIYVTVGDSPFENYDQFSNEELSEIGKLSQSGYKSRGVTYIKSDVYKNDQAKFLKIYTSHPANDGDIYSLQYNTVYDKISFNVLLQSYSSEIDLSKEALLKKIVDTIRFDAEIPIKFEPEMSEPFIYTDDSGLTFTVPANWVEEPLTEGHEAIDAKFVSSIEKTKTILFTGRDLLETASESEKQQISRSDIDNYLSTKANISEMYSCDESDVSMVTYAGVEYFCVETYSTASLYGVTASVPMTYFVRFDNGYMYIFQFSGHRDNEYYADLEALLNSAVYPGGGVAVPEIKSTPVPVKEPDINLDFGGLILSLILTVAIYSVPVIIFRYAIFKRPLDKKAAIFLTIIYGISAFIVMAAIIFALGGAYASGTAIFLWSFINYRILVGGEDRIDEELAKKAVSVSDPDPSLWNSADSENTDDKSE